MPPSRGPNPLGQSKANDQGAPDKDIANEDSTKVGSASVQGEASGSGTGVRPNELGMRPWPSLPPLQRARPVMKVMKDQAKLFIVTSKNKLSCTI